VTHKGAAADAGHYMGFVKKCVFHASKHAPGAPVADAADAGAVAGAGAGTAGLELDEEDDDWYKFDDDKVTVFPKEKLSTLDGGGGSLFSLDAVLITDDGRSCL
jgi:ubiquitin carboxyl-terminal hydrolase 14